MQRVVIDIVCFALVACVGYGVIYYKKNRRRLKCVRMKRYLTTHPTNGTPSEYFIDALERKFPRYQVEEYSNFIRIKLEDEPIAFVRCRGGILYFGMYPEKEDEDSDLVLFLKEWEGKEEWKAVSALMDCGCYCMKI